jgi:hypothetical protein
MPNSIEERLEVARRLPLHVLNFVQAEILKRVADPFLGNEPETSTDDVSEPLAIRPTRASSRSK